MAITMQTAVEIIRARAYSHLKAERAADARDDGHRSHHHAMRRDALEFFAQVATDNPAPDDRDTRDETIGVIDRYLDDARRYRLQAPAAGRLAAYWARKVLTKVG
jgi:hypothetical protein